MEQKSSRASAGSAELTLQIEHSFDFGLVVVMVDLTFAASSFRLSGTRILFMGAI